MKFTAENLRNTETRNDLIKLARKYIVPVEKTLEKMRYEAELKQLQIEMVNLQKWIAKRRRDSPLFLKEGMLPEKEDNQTA